MSRLMHRSEGLHVQLRGRVYYYVRRIPADLRAHYRADRVSISLRTRSESHAHRASHSLTQRLDDYWLGLRLQKADIPAISLLRTEQGLPKQDEFRLSDALALYLKLKGSDRDAVFKRTAQRNVEYAINVAGDKAVDAYSTTDAAKLRDWLIERGMGKATVKRVFSSVRAIVNLAISEQGLTGRNGFVGTYMPDSLRETERKPISLPAIRQIQNACYKHDDDIRWLVALISDTGMRLGEACGLAKSDIVLDADTPHVRLRPHPWRRLKTDGSERQIPLVGASLWAAKRLMTQNPTVDIAFVRYCNGQRTNANSASAALNKWLRTLTTEPAVIHGFRHSLRDRLRAVECPSDIVDQIGGWTTAGVGQGYGSGFPQTVAEKWLRKITY